MCPNLGCGEGGGFEEFYSQEGELRIRIKVSAGATFLCPEYIWQQLMMANCDLSGMEGACQVVNVFHWVGGLIQQKSSKTMEDQFSSVQLHSRVQLFTTPWTSAHQAFLSITNSWSLLKLMLSIGDVIQPSHSLSSASPPAFNLSQHQGLFK